MTNGKGGVNPWSTTKKIYKFDWLWSIFSDKLLTNKIKFPI